MKNNLIRAVLFITLGIVLFSLSMFTKNLLTEKLSSFALGLSFPLFITGIIAIVYHLKQARRQDQQ